ncbi:uncharacterized protein LOC141702704 [Apium graveolens]|uniref:uncharacterized protein LOC141702704 n=1 Tax=Apium graveolens TaxID=4045 RepID=UPI003D7A2C89
MTFTSVLVFQLVQQYLVVRAVKMGRPNMHTEWSSPLDFALFGMKNNEIKKAHGVWEAISPKDPKTTVVEDKVDKIALAAIYHGIPEDVLLSIADKETAKEAWDAIKVTCQGAERVKTVKVQTLKTEFESMMMKDTEIVDHFSMKLTGLVTNIRELGEEVAESYVVKKLFRAVPSKFLQLPLL